MDSRAQAPAEVPRVAELDGLRGFAILSVVLMHYFYNPDPHLKGPIHEIQRIFALGWSGVDLFFVLSGFLIGGILLEYRNSPCYFKPFYLRRIFRIFPIYYLWILLFIVLIHFGGPLLRTHTHSGQLPELNFSIYRHFLFLQNLWDVDYITLAIWWFSTTWSLAVEEQFYLVAPLLVRYLPQRLLPPLLGAIVVLAPLLRTLIRLHSGSDVNWPAYRLMPCRADALAIGMLLAYAWRTDSIRKIILGKPVRLYIVFSLLLIGMAVIWWRYPNPNDALTQSVGYSLIALFYAVLLIISIGLRSGPIAKFMRWGVLREFGRISYCLYLIHLVVGYFCFGFLTRSTIHFSDWRSGSLGLLSLAVAYGLSRISWTYFEHPLVQRGHRYKYIAENEGSPRQVLA
jgi:peptidoglycan/LPS O-acetylase OafA/YrhL